MRRVIDRKIYDTETAEEIAFIGNQLDRGNFQWEETYLYRTQKGTWFMAGSGGPASAWKRKCGDMWGGGEGILPCSSDIEVMELLELHGRSALIEQYFGDKLEEA